MKPKVSIIVPIYNVELYLAQCIDSIRTQTLKEIEIILINDGSPDRCPQLCDQYAAQDERIRVIHQKNAGVSAARNRGIEIATAEWLMFVDPDDWLEENAVEVLLEKANAGNCEFISAFNFFDDMISQKSTCPTTAKDQVFSLEQDRGADVMPSAND